MHEWLVAVAVVALWDAVKGAASLVRNARRERRGVNVIVFSKGMLLINYTLRPINIDAVGYMFRRGSAQQFINTGFESLCTVPPKDQKFVECNIGDIVTPEDIRYAFARDVCGRRTYKSRRITKRDVEILLGEVGTRVLDRKEKATKTPQQA